MEAATFHEPVAGLRKLEGAEFAAIGREAERLNLPPGDYCVRAALFNEAGQMVAHTILPRRDVELLAEIEQLRQVHVNTTAAADRLRGELAALSKENALLRDMPVADHSRRTAMLEAALRENEVYIAKLRRDRDEARTTSAVATAPAIRRGPTIYCEGDE